MDGSVQLAPPPDTPLACRSHDEDSLSLCGSELGSYALRTGLGGDISAPVSVRSQLELVSLPAAPPPPAAAVLVGSIKEAAAAIRAHRRSNPYFRPIRVVKRYKLQPTTTTTDIGAARQDQSFVKQTSTFIVPDSAASRSYAGRLRWLHETSSAESLAALRRRTSLELSEDIRQTDPALLCRGTSVFTCRECRAHFFSREAFYHHNGSDPDAVASFGRCAGLAAVTTAAPSPPLQVLVPPSFL